MQSNEIIKNKKFLRQRIQNAVEYKGFVLRKIKTQKELTEALKKEAINQGFKPVGIARVPGSERIQLRTAALERWLEAGNQGEMKWMAAPKRQKVDSLLEGVRSVLSVGLNYYVKSEKHPKALSVARFAWGKDYHKVIEKRLKNIGKWLTKERPDCKWRICVDSAPLLDKAWAEEAGIGWIGKHSNLINEEVGSWIVLGHLLCTEPLVADIPNQPRCGKCQKCLDACPTKAITEPFVVNSNLCLAYHTLENRESKLPKHISKSLNPWIAGCDICQEVCPWNHKKQTTTKDPDMQPQDWIHTLTSKEILTWDEETWKQKLNGSTLKRIKPWMWRRNAKAMEDEYDC